MYITKGIILSESDLPIVKQIATVEKCVKCNQTSYQNYCGHCGSKIEEVTEEVEAKLDICDFFNKFHLHNDFNYQIDNNGKVCICFGGDEYTPFVISTDVTMYKEKKSFENNKEVCELVEILKEHKIPYIVETIVVED
jgi:hypothetical protein